MTVNNTKTTATVAVTPGQECYDFAASIFPYCRSITGDGVRATLKAISNAISNHTVKLEQPVSNDVALVSTHRGGC